MSNTTGCFNFCSYVSHFLTVLHCIALHYIPKCQVAPCHTPLCCITLHSTALCCVMTHCPILQCTLLQFIALRCIVLHCNVLQSSCIALQPPGWKFVALLLLLKLLATGWLLYFFHSVHLFPFSSLPWIALHSRHGAALCHAPLHCKMLCSTALHHVVFYCLYLHCTAALQFLALHCNVAFALVCALHCIVLHCTLVAWHCIPPGWNLLWFCCCLNCLLLAVFLNFCSSFTNFLSGLPLRQLLSSPVFLYHSPFKHPFPVPLFDCYFCSSGHCFLHCSCVALHNVALHSKTLFCIHCTLSCYAALWAQPQWDQCQKGRSPQLQPGSSSTHTQTTTTWLPFSLSMHDRKTQLSWEVHKARHCFCCSPVHPLLGRSAQTSCQCCKVASSLLPWGDIRPRPNPKAHWLVLSCLCWSRVCWQLEPGWSRQTLLHTQSRHGFFIIMYAGSHSTGPPTQTKIALSTTKSEFIALSMVLCRTIPIMEMINELHKLGFRFGSTKSTAHYQVFEDNSGAIKSVTILKIGYAPSTSMLSTIILGLHWLQQDHHQCHWQHSATCWHTHQTSLIWDLLPPPIQGQGLRQKVGHGRECEETGADDRTNAPWICPQDSEANRIKAGGTGSKLQASPTLRQANRA